jgi:hypothetical protein
MHIYEKPARRVAWLLGFIDLRELLPHVLLPAATARSGGQGGAQAPAGVPLQHTALRKTPWMKTVEVLKT